MNTQNPPDDAAPDLRETARELHDAGLCVLPAKDDGTKRPDVRSWAPYKVHRSTPADHDHWFAGRRTGIGVVYGHVAGNIEMIELEGRAVTEGVLDDITDIMHASGLGDTWHALTTGWVTQSPAGGLHYRARVDGAPVPGNTKLASREAHDDELTDEERQRRREKPDATILRTLVETRGEAGFGVVEPSHGTVHSTGLPYRRIAGSPAGIPTVAADVMTAVRDVCRMMDTVPRPESARTVPRTTKPLPEGQVRPGDDYENRVDWADILGPLGWQFVVARGRTRYWRRPGKDLGASATTGHADDRDRLYTFTTSTEFDAETPYNKFGAYALIHHGGDHKAAARALADQGYGTRPAVRRVEPLPAPPARFDETPPADGANALQPDTDDVDDQGDTPGFEPRIVPTTPKVDITNEADAVDQLVDVMASRELPDLFKRSGGPCWIHEDDRGNPAVRQLGTDNLRAYLGQHVTTYAMTRDPATDGMRENRQLVMRQTCATILGRKDWPLPALRGIVTSPVLRPDTTLITKPGYDEATGLYLHPRVPLRRLREQIAQDSLDKAKHVVLDTMLTDFPWMAPSDRAQYLGALLSPIIRPYTPGPTPLVMITATSAGSGKTLLKDIFKYLYGLSEAAWPENDTELRKAVTAQLREGGDPVVAFDNLPNGFVLRSPILSSLVTADVWKDRVLGASETVSMPNDRLWIATGNNLRTGGDNARRALWVRIDPDCPSPDQRDDFTVGDLRPWLKDNASTVVAALVTMVRAWVAAGAPTIRTRMGDYSAWASVIAGLLDFLDVPGWLADRDMAAVGLDDETEEWAAFLEMWEETLGAGYVSASELLALKDHVPQLANGELPSAKKLGHWLKARQGRFFGPRKVTMSWNAKKKQNDYRVETHLDRQIGRDQQ